MGLNADCQVIQCLMPAVMKSPQAEGRLENRIPLTRPILIFSVRNNHLMLFLILCLLWFCFISFFKSLFRAISIKLLMLMCKVRFSSFIENKFFLDFHLTETSLLLNLHMKHRLARLPQERAACQCRAGKGKLLLFNNHSLKVSRSPPPLPADWFVFGWAGRNSWVLTSAIRC